jgi:2-hydroxychromene-2-carboxylate isomerase
VPQAERVLERGVAAYPYNGLLTARLAQQYAMDGQMGQARKLVEKYRALFPEDANVREVEKHLEGIQNVDPLTAPGRSASITAPK